MIRCAALKENKRQERENAIEDECEGPATSMHAVCVGAKHVKRGEQQATSRAESEPCACDGRPREEMMFMVYEAMKFIA